MEKRKEEQGKVKVRYNEKEKRNLMSFAITVFPSAAPRCRNTTCSTRPSRYACCEDFRKQSPVNFANRCLKHFSGLTFNTVQAPTHNLQITQFNTK